MKKSRRHFGKRSCNKNNCSMLKYQLKDYHISLLQKIWKSDACNQVKSCTKHGRPNSLNENYHSFKGIFIDSNSTFLWHKPEDINKQTNKNKNAIPKISVNSDFFFCCLVMRLCALALLQRLLC